MHCDCNSFFASVECVKNPSLKSVPMAVGGSEEHRHGIILAKNELAKKYNIKTAETIRSAKEKCPELVIVPPRHELYKRYSKRVMDIYKRYTDLVEPFGLDEAWLDVTGSKMLFGDGKTIADTLRREVYEETGLTISVGVSFCKVFAKLGSDYKKPDATTVFMDGWEKYIYPMDVRALLFVGRKTYEVLERLGIKTIGDLATADERLLIAQLGKAGHQLYIYANGLERESVKSIYDEDEVKSIGNGETFDHDILGEDEIRHSIRTLCESVARRLRKHNVKCTTIQLQIKTPDFRVIQRQKKTEKPTYIAREIQDSAMEIIRDSWDMKRPIRMITITASNLVGESEINEQISLFDAPDKKREKSELLEKTLDNIQSKFGTDMFTFKKRNDKES